MRRYRISTEKVRKRLDGSFIYSLDDGDVTIACRDREVAIFQKGNAVRMPLGQLKWLLEMCDEHYDNIKFKFAHERVLAHDNYEADESRYRKGTLAENRRKARRVLADKAYEAHLAEKEKKRRADMRRLSRDMLRR